MGLRPRQHHELASGQVTFTRRCRHDRLAFKAVHRNRARNAVFAHTLAGR
jgi:hypothetical protein